MSVSKATASNAAVAGSGVPVTVTLVLALNTRSVPRTMALGSFGSCLFSVIGDDEEAAKSRGPASGVTRKLFLSGTRTRASDYGEDPLCGAWTTIVACR